MISIIFFGYNLRYMLTNYIGKIEVNQYEKNNYIYANHI